MKHRFYHPLWKSFFSKELYVDVLGSWKGTGLAYLLFLSLILAAFTTYSVYNTYNEFLETDAQLLLDQVKPMNFEDGKLTTQGNQPFSIKDPDSGEVLAVVDPAGKLQDQAETAPVYFQKSQVVVQKSKHEKRIISFEAIGTQQVDRPFLENILGIIKQYLPWIIFPFIAIALYLWNILNALLLALVTTVMAKMLRVFVGFQECLRLVCVAMTPYLLLKTFGLFSLLPIPDFFLSGLGIIFMLGYAYFGLRSFKEAIETGE